MSQQDVIEKLQQERAYQDEKWGDINQRTQQVGSYLTIMRGLLGKAEFEWQNSNNDLKALDEIRQLTAVGIACLEKHGAPPRILNQRSKPKSAATVAIEKVVRSFFRTK